MPTPRAPRLLLAAGLLAAACGSAAAPAGEELAGGAGGASTSPSSPDARAAGGGSGGRDAAGPADQAPAIDQAQAPPPDTRPAVDREPDPADASDPPADAPPASGATSAGCGKPGALPEGPATIAVGGGTRSYTLRLPAGYTSARPWPLVLALHPNGNAGVGYWDGTARPLRTLLKDKAVLVLPVARPMGGGFDWRGDLPADLAYFDALLEGLKGGLCLDTGRVYAMGFSGGASFAGVLGCVRRDIRAIASAGGVTYFDPKVCVGKPAAWIAIGAGELIPAREEFRDFWRTRAGCQAGSSATAPAGCLAYACPPETPVHYCPHPGGHEWPGFGTQAAVSFFLGQ